MRKVVLSILFSLLCIGSTFSQFDVQFSQYMLNPASFNPAAAGESGFIQTTLQVRSQWMGVDTMAYNGGFDVGFGINSPIKIAGQLHGIGVRVIKDQISLFTNQSISFQYAYKKKWRDGILSLGIDAGLVSIGFAGSKISKINLGEYHNLQSDPVLPQTDVSGSSFDIGLGALYSQDKWYSGISYSHLNSPLISWTDKAEMKVNGTLYLTGGYLYALPNPKYVFKPSGLFKTDFHSFQVDLSGRMEYDNKYWGGLSYRFEDAVVVLAGLNLATGLSIGLSYDLPTSKILLASGASLELVAAYNFQYISQKKNTRYKSVRIL